MSLFAIQAAIKTISDEDKYFSRVSLRLVAFSLSKNKKKKGKKKKKKDYCP